MSWKFSPVTTELLFVPPTGTTTSSFIHIQPDHGTTPTATSPTDTLTLTSSDGSITITGNSSTDTINLTTTGGGGSPGGSATQLQYNNSGVFGGLPYSSVIASEAFLGLQQATPSAPLHVSGVYGILTPTPPTFTSTLTQVFPLNSPTTYTVTEIDSPTPPSTNAPTLTYVDPPNGGLVATYNPSGSYIATGQSILYNVYTYVLVNGTVALVNPNYSSVYYNDPLNDGSTFSVDLSGFTIGGAARYDGIIIWKQDNQGYGPYDINIPGLVSSTYADDQPIQNTDPYSISPYQATGQTWTNGVAQYILINGTQYTGAYSSASTTVDDSSSAYFYITNTWTVVGAQTYMSVNAVGNNHFDDGNTGTFVDYGQSGIPPFLTFASVAFPYFNTSGLVDGSLSSSFQNESEFGYTSNGSNYQYVVYAYYINPVNGVRYTDNGYTFTLYDNNDSNTFAWDITILTGTQDGIIVTVSVNGGPSVGIDLGPSAGSLSFTDNNTWTPIALHPISSYTGITRVYDAYGTNGVRYSNTFNTQTFTDSNPISGYVISHYLAGFNGSPTIKIINTTLTQHVTPDATIDPTTTVEAYSSHDSNITVTPNNIGYGPAAGQMFTYDAWAILSGVYSPTPITHVTTLPSDSNYYVVDLTIGTVAGATYKIEKIGSGFEPSPTTSFQDDLTVPWNGSNTVTPTSPPVTAAITERYFTNPPTDPGTIDSRNTGNAPIAYNTFSYNNSGTYTRIGTYGVASISGNFFVDSNATHGLDIGPLTTPHTRFQPTQGVFNLQDSNTFKLQINGGLGGVLSYFDANLNTNFFGRQDTTYGDPNSTVLIGPQNSDVGLIVMANASQNPTTTHAFEVVDQFDSKAASISNNGRMALGFTTTTGGSVLRLGQGGAFSGTDQLTFDAQNTLPVTSIAGSINRWDGTPIVASSSLSASQLLFTDVNSHVYPIAMTPGNSAGNVWHTDYLGANLVADNAIHYNYSGSTLNYVQFNATALFENGIATVNGGSGYINIGSALSITPTSGSTPNRITVAGALGLQIGANATNNRLGLWGTTAILQPANTVAWDTALGGAAGIGLRASGGYANFASALGLPYVAKTAAYALTLSDSTVDLSSGSFTFTLPTAVGQSGIMYCLSNSGSGTLTVATTSSQTIRGGGNAAATTVTVAQYHSITVQSDNANWLIISKT